MTVTTVEEIFDRVIQMDSSQYEGINAIVLFDLAGQGGGKWTVMLVDEGVKVEAGETASPDATLSLEASDLIAMANGQLNAVSAFMQGKIKVSGDMGLIMRLQSILT